MSANKEGEIKPTEQPSASVMLESNSGNEAGSTGENAVNVTAEVIQSDTPSGAKQASSSKDANEVTPTTGKGAKDAKPKASAKKRPRSPSEAAGTRRSARINRNQQSVKDTTDDEEISVDEERTTVTQPKKRVLISTDPPAVSPVQRGPTVLPLRQWPTLMVQALVHFMTSAFMTASDEAFDQLEQGIQVQIRDNALNQLRSAIEEHPELGLSAPGTLNWLFAPYNSPSSMMNKLSGLLTGLTEFLQQQKPVRRMNPLQATNQSTSPTLANQEVPKPNGQSQSAPFQPALAFYQGGGEQSSFNRSPTITPVTTATAKPKAKAQLTSASLKDSDLNELAEIEVPEFIRNMCSTKEKAFYNENAYKSTITGQVFWSLAFFLKDYPEDGTVSDVRYWVRIILENPERASNLPDMAELLSHQGRNTAINSLSSSGLKSLYDQEMPRPFNRSLVVDRRTNPFGVERSISVSLATLFPGIDTQASNKWWKEIPTFNPSSEDLSVRDYCAWYELHEKTFLVHGREKGNYALIVSVPSAVADSVIQLIETNLPIIGQVALMLIVGQEVYRILKEDPTQKVWNLTVGPGGSPTKN